MRKLYAIFLMITVFICAFIPATAADEEKIAVDVLILANFEAGDLTGDLPGEAQYYYEAYLDGGEEYEIGSGFENNKLYVKDGIVLYVNGIGKVNSALGAMAVLSDERFDFSNAYVLSTGSAGSAVEYGVIGDVFLITAAADYDLEHLADMREMESKNDAALFFDSVDDQMVYIPMNMDLMEKVYGLIQNIQLSPSEKAKSIMDQAFSGADWAVRDPKVLRGMSVSSDNYGKGIYDHADAVKMAESYNTADPYAVTDMEDIGIAAAMKRMGMLDRLIILRNGVNMDIFMAGAAPESPRDPDDHNTLDPNNSGEADDIFASAMKNNFLVGNVIIDAILEGYFDNNESENTIRIKTDGMTGVFLQTVEGLKAEADPQSGKYFSEITDAYIRTRNGKTSMILPADTTYLVWLKAPDSEAPAAYNAKVSAGNWTADLIQLIPLHDDPTLIINPPMHYQSGDGFAFEKLTIIAQPDAFPAFSYNANIADGTCTLSIDPTFSLFSAKDGIQEADAEMVITLFPDDDLLSVWITAIDHFEDFEGSKFMLNTHLSCRNENGEVSAHSLHDNIPVLNENGIIFFDIKEFLAGSESFFSGDLNGDDQYETVSSAGYFDFITSNE